MCGPAGINMQLFSSVVGFLQEALKGRRGRVSFRYLDEVSVGVYFESNLYKTIAFRPFMLSVVACCQQLALVQRAQGGNCVPVFGKVIDEPSSGFTIEFAKGATVGDIDRLTNQIFQRAEQVAKQQGGHGHSECAGTCAPVSWR